MSTGQRTAVALSVFFRLHTVLTNVPKFILLDEPVSNIDDLNIIGLLDFIRELVIKYNIQIFFTTANTNVKKLFRRKFSFFEEDFSEFNLIRSSSVKVKVIRKTYNSERLMNATQLW